MARPFVVLACVAVLASCTAKYPVVGAFDQYNEVFLGEVNANLLAGTSFIEVKAKNSGIKCTGASKVTFIPASNYIAGVDSM